MSAASTRREFITCRSAIESVRARLDRELPVNAVRFTRRAMACDFSVFLPAERSLRTVNALAALDVVDALESQLSVYRPESELSAVNRLATTKPVVIEDGLFQLLELCQQLWRETGGAFDITAGPLSRVWGFHQRRPQVPDAAEIQRALQLVGSDKIQLDDRARSVQFGCAGLEINLGSIGKGYALDRCRAELISAGSTDFLMHGGSSSVLAAGQRDWQVDLRSPVGQRPAVASMMLRDQAMATSGSANQSFVAAEKTLGHVLDPVTGWPVTGLLTATALAPTAALADALATAFFVMGIERSAAYCRDHPEVAAILMTDTDPPAAHVVGVLPARVEWHEEAVVIA